MPQGIRAFSSICDVFSVCFCSLYCQYPCHEIKAQFKRGENVLEAGIHGSSLFCTANLHTKTRHVTGNNYACLYLARIVRNASSADEDDNISSSSSTYFKKGPTTWHQKLIALKAVTAIFSSHIHLGLELGVNPEKSQKNPPKREHSATCCMKILSAYNLFISFWKHGFNGQLSPCCVYKLNDVVICYC